MKLGTLMNKTLFIVLVVIYLLLAWKNPFEYRQNLVSNFEPGPDVYYYSVPAWNWVHGDGFKMKAFGIEIRQIVPPLYGIFLSPFFKIFNDVRAYYFGNVLLGLMSIYLFLRVVEVAVDKQNGWINFGLGFVFVTNFYFYNLPTLLMAENILLPLTLLSAWLVLKSEKINFGLVIVLSLLLAMTKISAFPVIGIMWLWMFIKNRQIKLLAFAGIMLLAMVILTYLLDGRVFLFMFDFYKLDNFRKYFPLFVSEFIGNNGKYLWFNNQLLEMFVGVVSGIGAVVGLIKKDFRLKTAVLLSFIFGVTIFHSFMFYPEGRFISTIIPIIIILSGLILRKKWLVIIFLIIYLVMKVDVNGFYERKITTLKRQILNNRLVENEVSWNYMAIETINNYFVIKNDEVYLASLLPPFYFMYFKNGNYRYLPISEHQTFSGQNMEYIDNVWKKYGSLINLYETYIKENKKVYITNYYLNNHQTAWEADYKNIEGHFSLTLVNEGCLGLCNIYQLGLKK